MDFIQIIFSVFKSIFSFKLAFLFVASFVFYSLFLLFRRVFK